MTDNVRVAIRCRPLSEKEISDGYQSIVEFEGNRVIIEGSNDQPASKTGGEDKRTFMREYQFDQVFDWNSKQEEVYDNSCRPIVDSVLEGFNGTIFAYGQTGTGKTYTMEGSTNRKMSMPNNSGAGRKMSIKQIRPASSSSKRTGSNDRTGSITYDNLDQLGDSNSTLTRPEVNNSSDSDSSVGVIPRTFRHIFKHIVDHPEIQFLVRVSYLEIYQENIHDLLRKDQSIKLELHERPDIGIYVKDLTSFFCKSVTEIERVMRVGNQNRRVGATDMNEHSSRSHAIFMITVEQQLKTQLTPLSEGSKKERINSANASNNGQITQANDHSNAGRIIKVGKLNLIDLAGSESQKKTNSFGERQKESVKINLSLSALGNVINSLMKANQSIKKESQKQKQQKHHIPYRDSKLTRLLQDSLGGNAKTLMIANIGPASYNYDETINTLEYASRAKLIRNKPRLNEDPKDALLRELQKEINELRQKLAEIDGSGGGSRKHSATTTDIDTIKQDRLIAGSNKRGSRNSINAAERRNSNNDNNNKKLLSSRNNNNNKNSKTTFNQADNDRDHDESLLVEQELIDLKQKLASLEGKLLNYHNDESGNLVKSGGIISSHISAADKLESYMKRQEQELAAKQLELDKQKSRESAIRDELERKEEVEMLTKESFSSTKQEFDAKKRLIRQILVKVKQMRDNIESIEQTYTLELDELDQLQYELSKELKLKCLIMDNFVPTHHVNQLLTRIVYDEQSNQCLIKPFDEFQGDKCIRGDCGGGNLDHETSINRDDEMDATKSSPDNAENFWNYHDFWHRIINLGKNNNITSSSRNSSSGSKQANRIKDRTTFSSVARPQSEFERMEATLFPENLRFKYDRFIELRLKPEPIGDRPPLLHSSPSSSQASGMSKFQREADQLLESLNQLLDVQEPDIVI